MTILYGGGSNFVRMHGAIEKMYAVQQVEGISKNVIFAYEICEWPQKGKSSFKMHNIDFYSQPRL